MAILRMTVTDTLGFWDDYLGTHTFNPNISQTFTAWYRLPDGWLTAGGTLLLERRQAIFAYLYGPHWVLGNDDGSKYFVLKTDEHRLADAEAAARPWAGTGQSCYHVGEDGGITLVGGDAF